MLIKTRQDRHWCFIKRQRKTVCWLFNKGTTFGHAHPSNSSTPLHPTQNEFTTWCIKQTGTVFLHLEPADVHRQRLTSTGRIYRTWPGRPVRSRSRPVRCATSVARRPDSIPTDRECRWRLDLDLANCCTDVAEILRDLQAISLLDLNIYRCIFHYTPCSSVLTLQRINTHCHSCTSSHFLFI